MNPIDFSKEEFSEIMRRAMLLLSHGYFTGVNFIQSATPLPSQSIIVHFMQDSIEHIQHITENLQLPLAVVPRYTVYNVDAIYFDKKNFDKEYANATFFDKSFRQISIEDAKSQRNDISVMNREFDMLMPLNATNLEQIINKIKELDSTGPAKWEDPVIIVQSNNPIRTIPSFHNAKSYVNIRKNREEFYTIMLDETREEALKRYLKQLCEKTPKIGTVDENAIAFNATQINEEFIKYMIKQIKPLRHLE